MNLSLLLPGLLELASVGVDNRHPRLRKWLARAESDNRAIKCYEQALLDALGAEVPDNADIPAAQCSWIADFDESAPVLSARADPVFLKADKDHARLISADSLQLEIHETQDILASLNAHFEQDGVRFSAGQKDRWYVSGVQSAPPDTPPTSHAAGRNVSAFLSDSPQTARWRQITTEAQMLLHSHPVNQAREARGLQAVNSLWCWGAGKLALHDVQTECKLYSNAAFAVGLGKLTGMRVFPLQEAQGLPQKIFQQLDSQTLSSVIILDTRLLESILQGDTEQQRAVLAEWENIMLAVAEKMLLRGRLAQVRLDPCDGRQFILSRRALLRFWRKPKPVMPT